MRFTEEGLEMSFYSLFRRYGLFAVPIAIGLTAFGFTRFSKYLGPVVDAPAIVDLGRVDNHAFLDYDVPIRNIGQKDLILSNFRGGCATCLQFGVKTPDGPADVETLTVPPGGSVTIAAHLSIYGSPDQPFRTFIACSTNDPNRPELELVFEAAIRGQIIPFPPTLNFGELEPGQNAHRRIELRDTGRGKPFRFGRVVCPPHVRAEFVDADSGITGVGKPVGALAVIVAAPVSTWSLDGTITIYEEGRDQPIAIVPVRSAIPPVVEVFPTAVILPRTVGIGNDYTVECRFRSPKGLPVTVRPDVVPPELELTPLAPASGEGLGFRIEWRAAAFPPVGTTQAVTVRFHVEAGSRTEVIEIPIRCRSIE